MQLQDFYHTALVAVAIAGCPVLARNHGDSSETTTSSSVFPAKTSQCTSAIYSINSARPTAPASIASLLSSAHVDTAFPFTTIPAICLAASRAFTQGTDILAYSSWNNQVYSYYSEKSGEIVSAASAYCSNADKTTSTLDAVLTAYSAFSVSGCDKTLNTASIPNAAQETGSFMGRAALAAGCFAGVAAAI